jgi:hypothetical protein
MPLPSVRRVLILSKHYPVEQRERAVSMSTGRCIDSGARLKLPADLWYSRVSHGDSNAVRNFLPSLRAAI